MRCKKRILLAILVLLFAVACIGVLYWQKVSEDTLDLAAFKTNDMYCYQNLSWGSTVQEIEKILDESLTPSSATPNYYDCGIVKLKEYNASFQMEFTDSVLTSIIFRFPADEENPEQDYQLLEQKILDEFVKNYGDYKEQVEYTSIEGIKHRSTRWIVTNSENLTSYLYVGASYNSQRVLELTIMTGEMPPKAETE